MIQKQIFCGIGFALVLNGCSTFKNSMLLGVGTGVALGGIAGSHLDGDQGENILKGAVVGGVIAGLVAYALHSALEKRDSNVRRETLLNLEHYEVLGFEQGELDKKLKRSTKCFTTQEVDGRMSSIPCRFVNNHDRDWENNQ